MTYLRSSHDERILPVQRSLWAYIGIVASPETGSVGLDVTLLFQTPFHPSIALRGWPLHDLFFFFYFSLSLSLYPSLPTHWYFRKEKSWSLHRKPSGPDSYFALSREIEYDGRVEKDYEKIVLQWWKISLWISIWVFNSSWDNVYGLYKVNGCLHKDMRKIKGYTARESVWL